MSTQTANESIDAAAQHFIDEGLAQERHHEAGKEVASATAKQAIATLEAAQAMGRAGEQLRVAAMKVADIDTVLRFQAQQIKRLMDDVATLKTLIVEK